MNRIQSLLIIPSVIVLGFIMFLPAKTIVQKNTASVVEISQSSDIPPPSLEAKAALAMDLVSGKILYQKNAQDKLPLASLSKIISSLVIEDMLSATDTVRVSKDAIATQGESFLRVGEHFLVNDLLAMAMVESSNDAVTALVDAAAAKYRIAPDYQQAWFLDLMQLKAVSLGTSGMTFANPTGLDISTNTPGSLGSAADLLRIAQKTYASDIWRHSSIEKIISQEGRTHRLMPTNMLEGNIPQLTGSKTGFTDIAGGNLLVLFEYPINRPVGIVVLGSSSNGRFDDVKTLFDYVKASRLF